MLYRISKLLLRIQNCVFQCPSSFFKKLALLNIDFSFGWCMKILKIEEAF